MTHKVNSTVETIKFLYSYGGKIATRPTDGVLRYVGGFNRVLSVYRSITLSGTYADIYDVLRPHLFSWFVYMFLFIDLLFLEIWRIFRISLYRAVDKIWRVVRIFRDSEVQVTDRRFGCVGFD